MNLVARTIKDTRILLVLFFMSMIAGQTVMAQGRQTLFGDVKIDESGAEGPASRVTVVLYKDVGGEIGRQPISNRSRYRFSNLPVGDYVLAVEVDNNEIARVRVVIDGLSSSPYGFQQDLEFALKPRGVITRPGTVSAANLYKRSSANTSLFQKAQESVDRKKYDQAVAFLKQIVESDKLDFQAWTLLGTVHVIDKKLQDAESAYLAALIAKPTFALALIDLGRLRSSQMKFAEAIDPLTRAVEIQPQSGEANYLLGEAFIQLKQGSKALPFLNAAANNGRSDAHLRLGWLYNAAGLKDKAAAEYEEFLKKQPEYPDRKKLQDYINATKTAK